MENIISHMFLAAGRIVLGELYGTDVLFRWGDSVLTHLYKDLGDQDRVLFCTLLVAGLLTSAV